MVTSVRGIPFEEVVEGAVHRAHMRERTGRDGTGNGRRAEGHYPRKEIKVG